MNQPGDFLDLLDAMPRGVASFALPDWGEGDPRWLLFEANHRRGARRASLQLLGDLIERAWVEDVRAAVEAGVSRPAAARELGVSIGELKRILGES